MLWQQVHFPQLIAGVVVGCIPKTLRSEAGRARTREALRQMLAQFCGGDITFEESPTGPIVPPGGLPEQVSVSISYANGAGWIALAKGFHVGIDAVGLRDCMSCELVAPLYFEPKTCMDIYGAENPAEAFALQWTILEACLKAARLPLVENPELPEAQVYSLVLPEVALSVALIGRETAQC